MCGYQCGTLNCSARFFALSGLMSQTLTTSTKGDWVKTGRYWPETLPHPITAVRIFFGGSAENKLPEAAAAPARSVVFVKSRRVMAGEDFIGLMPYYFRNPG